VGDGSGGIVLKQLCRTEKIGALQATTAFAERWICCSSDRQTDEQELKKPQRSVATVRYC
jgi:hypothetical protein